jgi:NAD(P)H-dependent flavin oxidoreductase YrpB (nitropropane dioxygenase family)
MFKTRVTEMLGIKYPIVCGAMSFITRPEMVAAIANAGGLGFLPSAWYGTPEKLREAIKKTKSLTDKPFGVNINYFPSVKPLPTKEFVEVIVEEKVKAVESAGHRDPGEIVPRLHEGGVIVIHKSATVRHALKAEEVGADIITIVGMENGGATGTEDVGTIVLLPALTSQAKVPVLGGGGFADGRGLVAALALGAEGIVMGTRFMATKECPIHDNYKQRILNSTERDTYLAMRSIQNTHRMLKNKYGDKIRDMEAKGASLEELLPFISGEKSRKAAEEGDLEAGYLLGGEAIGLIHDIPTTKELIDRIMDEAESIYKRLGGIGFGAKDNKAIRQKR